MNNNHKLLEKLKEYEQEHSDLDQILIQLQEKHTVDFLIHGFPTNQIFACLLLCFFVVFWPEDPRIE